MLTVSTAKRIGSNQILKAVTIGLVIAYLIFALIAGPFWIFTFTYSFILLFAASVLYMLSYFVGSHAGKLILINKYPSVLVGIIAGFLVIVGSTFLGSLIGFFTEGLHNNSSISQPVQDYILKPIAMVTFWGGIPIFFIGIWYGLSIERLGRKAQIDTNQDNE